MKIEGKGSHLRIYIGEDDRYNGNPLSDEIILKARQLGLAGCTVIKGMAGFGANSRIHTSKILRLSEELPIVIEIIDIDERIDKFLPVLDEMVSEGLVIREATEIIHYRHGDKS